MRVLTHIDGAPSTNHERSVLLFLSRLDASFWLGQRNTPAHRQPAHAKKRGNHAHPHHALTRSSTPHTRSAIFPPHVIDQEGSNLIFLLGLPRSGTTLLSAMLGNHPLVHCPPEPWLLLALDAIGLASAHHPADSATLYKAFGAFRDDAATRRAARLYAAELYNHHLRAAGKSIFIDKTPRYHLLLPRLRDLFPHARFLFLWRNPLDVAASIKTTWHIDIPLALRDHQDELCAMDYVLAIDNLQKLHDDLHDQAVTIRYEELVADPEKQMAREMYVMAAKLNKKYFKGEKDSLGVAKLSSVNCYTCHNGVAHLETATWPRRGDAPHPPAPAGMGAPSGQPAPQGGGGR